MIRLMAANPLLLCLPIGPAYGRHEFNLKRPICMPQEETADKSSLAERFACLQTQVPKKKIRLGLPATQWITIYNAHRPMKQRYHYNVANTRVDQHVEKGNDDGLYISSVACCHELWALIMDAGTGFSAQVSRTCVGLLWCCL